MNDEQQQDSYLPIPYAFLIETTLDALWLTWETTPWDTPSLATYKAGHQETVDEIKELFRNNSVGFQGYPIEDIFRPSPLDIYCVLCRLKAAGRIRDFMVAGPIPDAPSAPNEDIEPDDDDDGGSGGDDNGTGSSSESQDPVPSITEPKSVNDQVAESIPVGTKIRLPFILEDTGETVYVETDAQAALDEVEAEAALYESILKRMGPL